MKKRKRNKFDDDEWELDEMFRNPEAMYRRKRNDEKRNERDKRR